MSDIDDYTASQIEIAMSSAMRAHDMPAVVSLLHILALKDPRRAQHWLTIIELAGEVSDTENRSDSGRIGDVKRPDRERANVSTGPNHNDLTEPGAS